MGGMCRSPTSVRFGIRFANRSCFTGALVLGDSILLGSIPMEDMDLVISSREQRVTVNPESPNIPSAVVKAGRSAPRFAGRPCRRGAG